MSDVEIKIPSAPFVSRILDHFRETNRQSVLAALAHGTVMNTNRSQTQEDWNRMINVPYNKIIGSLLYPANKTRLDISYVTGLSSPLVNYLQYQHQWAGHKVLQYLNGTGSMGLEYRLATQS